VDGQRSGRHGAFDRHEDRRLDHRLSRSRQNAAQFARDRGALERSLLPSEGIAHMKFRTRLRKCDVTDEARLAQFRIFLKNSDKMIKEKNRGIWAQFVSLLLIERQHRLLREVARINPDVLENRLFWNFIDSGYANLIATGIRRLLSTTKGDVSVRHLINEIEKNRNLFTRENYICFDGYPYDPEPEKIKYRQAMLRRLRSRKDREAEFFRLPSHGKRAWSWSESAHNQFDALSGTNHRTRKRSDVLSAKPIELLRKKLEACTKTVTATNKVFVHADARISIGARRRILSGLTYAEIERQLKSLSEVIAAISSLLLQLGHNSCVAVYQSDVTEALDSGLIQPDQRAQLRKIWNDQSDVMSNWSDANWLIRRKPKREN
jgi:hypothetical protein